MIVAVRTVPAPLAQLPNALTIVRLALVPLFIGLVVASDHGALVSSGFPSRRSLGGRLAPPAKFALSPATPFC